MFKKIVAVDRTGIDEFVRPELEALCGELEIYNDFPVSDDETVRRCTGADAVLVSWNTPVGAGVIERLPELKYIGMCCSLIDEDSANVDVRAARSRGIDVRGVRDYGDEGVVEFIISELVRIIKGLGALSFRDEQVELGGLKLGILGLGTLGKMTADAGRYFGMEVSYHNRRRRDDVDYPCLTKPELLANSDIVSIHLPRNTTGLERDDFRTLGSGKILVSTGLGLCFDEEDFAEWIQGPGNFAIFDIESLTPGAARRFGGRDNVIISNKVTGFTRNARARLAAKAVQNINDYLSGNR